MAKKIDLSILASLASPKITKKREVRVLKKRFKDLVNIGNYNLGSELGFNSRVFINSSLSSSAHVMIPCLVLFMSCQFPEKEFLTSWPSFLLLISGRLFNWTGRKRLVIPSRNV